ncbi:uncharacterized protein METZ01_LOCUS101239 [marine metagenome]|uniref:Uncharacterized protein n=1 Tax=marine metagenome TaxID=408172 RepID=A0A381W7D8_9ZZZZ
MIENAAFGEAGFCSDCVHGQPIGTLLGDNNEGCLQNFVLLVITSHAFCLLNQPVGIVKNLRVIRNTTAQRISLYFQDKTRFA